MWVWVFIGLIMAEMTWAALDLYVDSSDVKQLLGVDSQLWYVHNGTVNHYALSYSILVPAQLDSQIFYWRALHGRTMPYSLSVETGNSVAVSSPSYNISDHGLVPPLLTAWVLNIPCTGKLSTEVDITVTLQVPMNTSLADITTLTILRRKVCHKDIGVMDGVVGGDESDEGSNASQLVWITVSVLAMFLAMVSALAMLTHINHNKARRCGNSGMEGGRCSATVPNNQRQTQQTQPQTQQSQQQQQGSTHGAKASQSSLSELRRSPQPTTTTNTTTTTTASPEPQYTDPRLTDIAGKIAGAQIARERVEVGGVEEEGTFGRVCRALLHNAGSPPTPVTIKTITESASEVQRSVLLSEGLMLSGICHEQLLGVIGVLVTPTTLPPAIVLPAASHGNLKRFLQGCHTLVTREVVSVGVQVLQGLSFLHSRLLLHKDVATRNCVVDEGLHVRLGDCALSRDLYPGDYHCLGDNENRPIKWLALESLTHKMFTPASDVWSWGVLLWEVMTLGQQPYAEIDPFEMASVLRGGVRLAQPINCPDELFKAMTFCWTAGSKERPSVDELALYLTNFQHHLDHYV